MVCDFLCGCPCGKDVGRIPVSDINKDNRSCTDVLCLLLFIVFWAGLFVVMGTALDRGDPDRLLKGIDVNGYICGEAGTPVANRPFAYWPDPTEYEIKYCAANCNETYSLASCPLTTYLANNSSECSPVISSSEAVPSSALWVYCYPDVLFQVATSTATAASSQFGSLSDNAARLFNDLQEAAPAMIVLCASAIVWSILWLIVIRYLAGCLVYTSIALVLGCLGALGFFFYDKASKLGPDESHQFTDSELFTVNRQTLEYTAYTLWGITALMLLVVLCLFNSLRVAVAVVKTASSASSDLKWLFLLPLGPFLYVVLYVVFFIYISVWIFSIGTLEDRVIRGETIKDFTWDDTVRPTWAYFFFGFLWNIQFTYYFTYFVAAGAVADWYFSTNRSQLGAPVLSSAWRTVRYHLGTIAFGSLVIAIIQFIRACVYYIKQKVHNKANKLQEIIFCMIQCCLWCLEKCLDFLSKNAFIYCSIFGDSFCISGARALSLLLANLAKVAAISVVSNFLLLMGRLMVALLSALIAALLFTYSETYGDLSSTVIPVAIVFIGSFAVASVFVVIYETIIDAMFLCYLVDVQRNPPDQMLAPAALKDLVSNYSAQSAEAAKKIQGQQPQSVEVQPMAQNTGGGGASVL